MAFSDRIGARRVIVPVILSGGSGTRLWPLSTPERPKQFLALTGPDTLFQETLKRVSDRLVYEPPVIVANAAHEDLLRAEIAGISGAQLVLEPVARNTAVAIVMAAVVVKARSPEAIMLVMPSDHLINVPVELQAAIKRGCAAAAAGQLVAFGIQPTGPETGYGYLEAGSACPGLEEVQTVARFKEKPDRAAAEEMIAAGGHYWNGGIFMFRADRFLEECARLAPEIYWVGSEALRTEGMTEEVIRPPIDSLEQCPNISVDYAVMERSEAVVMVPLAAGWSDVGSWDTLADLKRPEEADGSSASLGCERCYIRSEGPEVTLIGVKDLIVVATRDHVVIMQRGRSQECKNPATVC